MISDSIMNIMNKNGGYGITICVDFDGTCVTHSYPEVGEDIGAVPVLKKLVESGNKIILYTMRSDRPYKGRNLLQEAIDWFAENDIPLYGVNAHPGQSEWTDSPKAHCELSIDDRNLGCPTKIDYNLSRRPFVDWKKVEEILNNEGIL